MKRNSLIISALAGAFVLGGGFWLFHNGESGTAELPGGAAFAESQPSGGEASEVEQKAAEITDMVMGSLDAPVSVVEYASFTCPHCASFHSNQFKQLKANYIDTGKVKFTFREVYFDKFGLWASMIARCGEPERFFPMTDMLFASQSRWIQQPGPQQIVDALRKVGRGGGLSEAQLDACLSDADMVQKLVAWYQQNAEADDVTATPSLVINGKKYPNMSYSEMSKVIDEALSGT